MKKLILAVLCLSASSLWARQTSQGSTDADTWCTGPANAEVCADKNGAFIPTVTNNQDLGTSALKWRNLKIAGSITGAGIVTSIINVKDYGAVCDSATDDLAAFNLALAAIRQGQTLYVPNSTGACYLSGNPTLPGFGFTIKGAGWVQDSPNHYLGSRIVKNVSDGLPFFNFVPSGAGDCLNFEDIVIEGSGGTGATAGTGIILGNSTDTTKVCLNGRMERVALHNFNIALAIENNQNGTYTDLLVEYSTFGVVFSSYTPTDSVYPTTQNFYNLKLNGNTTSFWTVNKTNGINVFGGMVQQWNKVGLNLTNAQRSNFHGVWFEVDPAISGDIVVGTSSFANTFSGNSFGDENTTHVVDSGTSNGYYGNWCRGNGNFTITGNKHSFIGNVGCILNFGAGVTGATVLGGTQTIKSPDNPFVSFSLGVTTFTVGSGKVGIGGNPGISHPLTIYGNGTGGINSLDFIDTSNTNKSWRVDQSVGELRFIESGTQTPLRLTPGGGAVFASSAAFSGSVGLYSRTMAQLLAIAPVAVGEQYYCNNCTPAKGVISTGTSAGNFADMAGGQFK